MKKATAWLLLTTYLCASCAWVAPLIGDALAHVFWHDTHIEHVHHGIEGHSHVAVEIAQLLNANPMCPAEFSELSGGAIYLSAHIFLPAIFAAYQPEIRHFTPFPAFGFTLPPGVVTLVFLPPERA